MEQLTIIQRTELEIEMRKMAIFIALHSGSPGVEFFCRQFPDMAKELAHTFEKETNYPVSLTKA